MKKIKATTSLYDGSISTIASLASEKEKLSTMTGSQSAQISTQTVKNCKMGNYHSFAWEKQLNAHWNIKLRTHYIIQLIPSKYRP